MGKNTNKQTEPKKEEANSKTLDALKKEYAENPNKALRRVSTIAYAKAILGVAELSWTDFCEMKIKAYTDHWNERKSKGTGRAPKIKSAEDLKKAKEKLEKAAQKQAALKAQIEAAEKALSATK